MSVAIITGSAGLIGSEAVRYFAAKGMDIAGLDNDMRKYFFGEEASTEWMRAENRSLGQRAGPRMGIQRGELSLSRGQFAARGRIMSR